MVPKGQIMNNSTLFLILLGFVGLGVGLFAGTQFQEDQAANGSNYCDGIEEELRQNESISGAISCSEPGSFEQDNLSKMGNLSELACICEYSVKGQKEILAIRRTQ